MSKVKWMSNEELQVLAKGAFDAGVSLKDAKAKFHAGNWEIDGKTIYWKKFCAMWYSCERSKDINSYWS